jgi:hypothetical protein
VRAASVFIPQPKAFLLSTLVIAAFHRLTLRRVLTGKRPRLDLLPAIDDMNVAPMHRFASSLAA